MLMMNYLSLLFCNDVIIIKITCTLGWNASHQCVVLSGINLHSSHICHYITLLRLRIHAINQANVIKLDTEVGLPWPQYKTLCWGTKNVKTIFTCISSISRASATNF